MLNISRRSAILGAAALAACATIGTGIAQAEDQAKVLRICFPSTLTTLDVLNGDGATCCREVAGCYETLVNVDSEFALSPSLATSWERVADTAWVFHLREGVLFHDGTEFNAGAVKWCFDRAVAESTNFTGYTKICGTDVIDDYTVQLNTSVPNGEVPEALCNVVACIIAPSSCDETGAFVKPVSTGYFQYKNFDVSTGNAEFEVFPEYWGGEQPSAITERHIKSISDSSTRSLAAQNGEVDIATDVPFTDLMVLESHPNVDVEKFETARTYFATFNVSKPHLADVDIRRGLLYAINYEEMVGAILMGVGTVPNGIFMSKVPWNNTECTNYSYDPELAAQLFDAAGFVDTDGDGYRDYDGQKVVLTIVTGSRRPGNALIAQALYGYFDAVGVAADVQVLEGSALSEASKGGLFDIYLNSAATGYIPSASYYLNQYYKSTSSNMQVVGFEDAELDTLIDECCALENSPEKIEASKAAQVLAQDDAVVATMANYGAVFVLDKKLTGFSYSAAVHDFIVPYTVDITE